MEIVFRDGSMSAAISSERQACSRGGPTETNECLVAILLLPC